LEIKLAGQTPQTVDGLVIKTAAGQSGLKLGQTGSGGHILVNDGTRDRLEIVENGHIYMVDSAGTLNTALSSASTSPCYTHSNFGIGTSSFGTNAAKVFGIKNGTPPTSSPADIVQLFAKDVSNSSELFVRDEAGNETQLSPHNFSVVGGPSEEMAWSYFSRKGKRVINIDMLKVIRVLERLSGERLVCIKETAE